jgi:hypothetical protein
MIGFRSSKSLMPVTMAALSDVSPSLAVALFGVSLRLAVALLLVFPVLSQTATLEKWVVREVSQAQVVMVQVAAALD